MTQLVILSEALALERSEGKDLLDPVVLSEAKDLLATTGDSVAIAPSE